MNKIYNLKQDVFYTPSDSLDDLTELQSMNKKTKRTNEVLNVLIFLIGVAGFFLVFSMQNDDIYNSTNLKDSFRNSNNSSNAAILYQGFSENNSDLSNEFQINGYLEADETLNFEYKNYQPTNGVEYIINFGNGDFKRIEDKVTTYKYLRLSLIHI